MHEVSKRGSVRNSPHLAQIFFQFMQHVCTDAGNDAAIILSMVSSKVGTNYIASLGNLSKFFIELSNYF